MFIVKDGAILEGTQRSAFVTEDKVVFFHPQKINLMAFHKDSLLCTTYILKTDN